MQRVVHALVRAKGYLLFALLGGFISLVLLRIAFMVEDLWGHEAFIRWDGLGGFTLGLFGLFVCDSEKFLRKPRFWVMVAILLVLHLVVFILILTHVDEWKLTWFMVMVTEYPPFLLLRERFATRR